MGDGDGKSAPPVQNDTIRVQDLLRNCHALLHELEAFRAFLVQRRKAHTVEIRQFRNSVQAELKSLEKLSTADFTADRTIHTLHSSNLPFYSAVWATAKGSTGLVAFHKRFYWDLHPTSDRGAGNGNARSRRRSALVDIVARNGEEWVKVSTVTATRLLFERAKAGWEDAGSSSGSERADEDVSEDSEAGEGVGLVKLAEDLRRASLATRVRHRHPQVRFVLPKIREGAVPEVDEIIEDIRRTGAIVQCQNDLELPMDTIPATDEPLHPPSTSTSTDGAPHPLDPTFHSLLPNPSATFTPTLNIDCTILLALVSDLSHGAIKPEPWFHRAIRRQIELEAEEPVLPCSLWPAMGGRDLVCTVEAATRMREIVDTIGTEAEKVRTRLLMGDAEGKGERTREELVEAFAEVSEYEVPEEWRLPIRVLGKEDICLEGLPAVAGKVAEQLTAINRSVFLYGWASGRTTISSNRTVAKLIESVVEENRTSEEDRGPDVWLCPTARSLVGKEKGRRD